MVDLAGDVTGIPVRKRIWGWYFFDWASQPYSTLLLTFIFGPYFAQVAAGQMVAAGADPEVARANAQAYWGYGLTAAGIVIALLAPILGAVSDNTGRRMPWVRLFSALYIVGAAGLWWTAPADFSVIWALVFFGIGMIGMEFATIFTNAFLPSLADKEESGRISGDGWAFGYLGGVAALVIMLAFFQATDFGKTIAGFDPLFGLSTETRADTRVVGPFTALWYVVFMVPFFLYVRDIPVVASGSRGLSDSLRELLGTIKSLPKRRSFFAYLGSSMLYRDALNGLYTFGGIYALGVLGWSVVQVGIFGIIGAISGAAFCVVGGRLDRAFGPKPVIVGSCVVLMLTAAFIISLTPTSIIGIPVVAGSSLPDTMFFVAGALVGGAGGTLQSSSRNMLTRQGKAERMTEAFGLYALSGKATTFLAPLLIGVTSQMTGSQRLGVLPLVVLFLLGLILLLWVKADGDTGEGTS
ncbi:MAG: MFS transporter [Pseudomonadota bacterium]